MRKVLGVIFILISTIVGVVVLLGWGIRTSLLASQPWKSSLAEARVYDRLLVEALPEIAASKSVTNDLLENAPLTPNDLVAIAQGTISAPFLQQQVERGFDVAFDLLQSRTTLADVKFVIPLQDIKRKLPIAVQERLAARLQALPICTADKLKEFDKFKTLSGALPPCRPKDLDVQAIVRDSLKVNEVSANIPATFDAIAELQKQQPTGVGAKTPAQQVAAIQDKVRFIFQLHGYITLAWVILLLSTAALFIAYWRRVVQWFAIVLFVPSVLIVAATLVGRSFLPEHFTLSDPTAQVLVNIGQPVASTLAHIVMLRLLVLGGVGAVAAAVLFTLAFSFPRRLKT